MRGTLQIARCGHGRTIPIRASIAAHCLRLLWPPGNSLIICNAKTLGRAKARCSNRWGH